MAMSNAERQKRYRDRKRGGPPRGRWYGHGPVLNAKQHFAVHGCSRTTLFMGRWLWEHAPDAAEDILDGSSEAKVSPTYRKLRREFEAGVVKAISEGVLEGHVLTFRRENGKFIFEWSVPDKQLTSD